MEPKQARIIFAALLILSFAFLIIIAIPKEEQKPIAFFAYGTNLDRATMKARAGGFENATAARLEGYRLAFQSSKNREFGVANIVQDEPASVPGAVYFLTAEQMASLDKSAGFPNFYNKKDVKALLAGGSEISAVAYYLNGNARFEAPSRPTVLASSKGLEQFGYGQEEQSALVDAAMWAQKN